MTGPKPAPEAPDRPEVIAQPPLLAVSAFVAALVLDKLWPRVMVPEGLEGAARFVAGPILFAAGFVIVAAAVIGLLRAGTNVPVHLPALKLVTGGIYRFSRNPIYAGLLLAFLGCALMLNAAWFAAMAAVLALALHYGVVRPEERYLLTRFGEPYRDYLARTRRWF